MTTELISYDDELKKLAQEAVSNEAGTGLNYISTQGGILKYKDNPIPGNSIDMIVLDSVFEYAYYDTDYDPDNPKSPVCFAISREVKGLSPHEMSESPQNEECESCPKNEFGSADRGKGKACKNTKRLCLLPPDIINPGIEDVAFLKIPVTSVKDWGTYVSKINLIYKLPPLGVITRIKLTPNPKTQFKVCFEFVELVNSENISNILSLRKGIQENLNKPYEPILDSKPEVKNGRKY